MDPRRHSALNHVSATFAEWKGVQEEVKPLEVALNAALLRHAQGESAFPDELVSRVEIARRRADELFARATEALQAIPNRL